MSATTPVGCCVSYSYPPPPRSAHRLTLTIPHIHIMHSPLPSTPPQSLLSIIFIALLLLIIIVGVNAFYPDTIVPIPEFSYTKVYCNYLIWFDLADIYPRQSRPVNTNCRDHHTISIAIIFYPTAIVAHVYCVSYMMHIIICFIMPIGAGSGDAPLSNRGSSSAL